MLGIVQYGSSVVEQIKPPKGKNDLVSSSHTNRSVVENPGSKIKKNEYPGGMPKIEGNR